MQAQQYQSLNYLPQPPSNGFRSVSLEGLPCSQDDASAAALDAALSGFYDPNDTSHHSMDPLTVNQWNFFSVLPSINGSSNNFLDQQDLDLSRNDPIFALEEEQTERISSQNYPSGLTDLLTDVDVVPVSNTATFDYEDCNKTPSSNDHQSNLAVAIEDDGGGPVGDPAVGAPQDQEQIFPWKLHRMLEDSEHQGFQNIVSWVKGGAAFKVHDSAMFLKKVMPNYFDQTKYESFRRQLNLYGFTRITRGSDRGIYSHARFQKANRQLCRAITRRATGAPCPTTSSAPLSVSLDVFPSSISDTSSDDGNEKNYYPKYTARSSPQHAPNGMIAQPPGCPLRQPPRMLAI